MGLARETVGGALGAWLDGHVAPTGVLAEMYAALADHPQANMMTHPDLGRLLGVLVSATGARRVLEVGTFVGVSSLWMAQALPADGRLDTLDISDAQLATARQWLGRAGVAERVSFHIAPADRTMAALDGPYDLAYIDADKPGYPAYLDAAARLVRPGGIVVADNLFLEGRVTAPEDENAAAMAAFAGEVMAHEAFETTLLTVGDGISLSVRRPA